MALKFGREGWSFGKRLSNYANFFDWIGFSFQSFHLIFLNRHSRRYAASGYPSFALRVEPLTESRPIRAAVGATQGGKRKRYPPPIGSPQQPRYAPRANLQTPTARTTTDQSARR